MKAMPVSSARVVYVAGAPFRKKNWWPIHPLPTPNMNANPNAQKSSAHRHVSTMHSCRMLTTSRVRAKPASSIMKPACMKNTRKAATSTHAVFVPLITEVSCSDVVLRVRDLADHDGADAEDCSDRGDEPDHLPREVCHEEDLPVPISQLVLDMSISRIPPVGSSGWRTGSD